MWDFSTEPEFAAKLEWARGFMTEHVYALEVLEGIDEPTFMRAIAPLRAEVKERGPVGRAPPARARRPGLRPGQARAHARGPRHDGDRADGVRQPGARLGNGEIIAHRRHARAEGALRRPAAGRRDALGVLDDRARRGRLGPDARSRRARSATATSSSSTATSGSAPTDAGADLLIVMAVTDPDAPPHRRASMFIVPVDTPGVNILRDVPTMEFPGGHTRCTAGTPRSSTRTCASPPDALLGDAGRGLQDRPAAARPRAHPPLHALPRPLQRAFDMLCERATLPREPRPVLADHQTVQNWIADSAAQMHAARLMTLHAAWTPTPRASRPRARRSR